MPDFPWKKVKEVIKRLRQVDLLEWIYYVRYKDLLFGYVP